MSGDVQPRKRKDKRRKKDPQQEYVSTKMKTPRDEVTITSEEIPSNFSLEETFHIHKDSATGGNICTKVVFFCLLSALAVMVGLLLTEYHGSTDVDTPISESRWAAIFDGWIDEFSNKNDNHAEHIERHEDEDENEKDDEDHDNNNDIANHDEEENNSNHEEEDDSSHDEEDDDSNHDEEEDDGNHDEEEDDINHDEEEDDSNYDEDDDIEPIEENTSEEPLDENELFVSEEVDSEEDNEKDIEGDEDEDEDEELDTDLEDNETEEMDEGEINKEDVHDDDEDDNAEQVIPGVLKESNSGDDESSEEDFPEDQLESEENEDYEDNTLDQQEEQADSGEAEGYEVKIAKDHHKAQDDGDEGDEDYDSNEIENVSKSENDLDEIEGYQIAAHKEEMEIVVEERESTENDEPETAGVALKFGVGVALVLVAHIVLVKKWSTSEEQERTIVSEVDEVPELILRRQTLITEGSVQEQYPYLEQIQDNKNKNNNLEEGEESKETLSLPKSTENFSSQILQDFWKNPVDYIKDNEEEMAEDKTFLTQTAAHALFSSTHQSSDEEEGEDLSQKEDVVEYEESEDEEEEYEEEEEEENEDEEEEEENEDEEEEADIKNRIERILSSAGESESGEEESSESESVSDLEGKTKNESGEHQRLERVLNAAETNLETDMEN